MKAESFFLFFGWVHGPSRAWIVQGLLPSTLKQNIGAPPKYIKIIRKINIDNPSTIPCPLANLTNWLTPEGNSATAQAWPVDTSQHHDMSMQHIFQGLEAPRSEVVNYLSLSWATSFSVISLGHIWVPRRCVLELVRYVGLWVCKLVFKLVSKSRASRNMFNLPNIASKRSQHYVANQCKSFVLFFEV